MHWALVGTAIYDILGFFHHPSFHGSLKPRPSDPESTQASDGLDWDNALNDHLGLPAGGHLPGGGIGGAIGLPSGGCDFGACGNSFGQANGSAWDKTKVTLQLSWQTASLLFTSFLHKDTSPSSEWPLNGNDWPGSGFQDQVCSTGPFAPKMNSNPAILKCCQAHDNCYTTYRCNYSSWLPGNPINGACRSVCNATVVGCIINAK